MFDENYTELALAVIDRAVKDWRMLCKGEKVENSNFKELERFFSKKSDVFLLGTKIDSERLWQKMQREKRRAVKNGKI